MKKRLIALLLVLVLAACVFPVSAFADGGGGISLYSIDDRSNNGYYNIYILNQDYLVPSNTVLSNDGGTTWRRATEIAQLKLTEFSVDFNVSLVHPGSVDGYFGNGTASAVSSFQSWWNNSLRFSYGEGTIGVDSIIGGETWSAFSYYIHLNA